MNEEKELVFLDPEDVPKLTRGVQGKNWMELFDKIPKGKVVALDETYGSPPNIRVQVKNYNKRKKTNLEVTQRTDKEIKEITVYVLRPKG